MMRPPPGWWSSRDECGTKTRRLLLLLSPGAPSRVADREKRPLFETTKASLSTKGGKTEPRRRPPWASKGNTNASSIESRPLLSSNFCDDSLFLSLSLSLSLKEARSLSKSSSSLERDDDDPPPLSLPLCRRCCSLLDEKQSQHQHHHRRRKQREKEQRFLAASFETFFFCPFFFVSLFCKCLGYYIEKKRTVFSVGFLLFFLKSIFFQRHYF